jgi:lysophospholipase
LPSLARFPRLPGRPASRRLAAGRPRPDPQDGRQGAVGTLCEIAGNPVPPRPRVRILPHRGAALRTVAWLPSGAARGTVLLLLGRGDFIEKYFEVVSDLLSRHWAVATFDWRGQGGSQRLLADPGRGHVDSFAGYVGDLEAVADRILPGLPRPHVGLAHSMGAAILLHGLAARPGFLARAVLTAPMLALSPWLAPRGARLATRLAERLGWAEAPVPGPSRRGLASPGFDPDNLLTSDPVRFGRSYEILRAAPHLGVGKPTIGWLAAAYDGMDALRTQDLREAVSTPLLTVVGDRDRVIHAPAAAAFSAGAASRRCLVLDGAAHDLMLERDGLRDRFWTAFDAFTGPNGGL